MKNSIVIFTFLISLLITNGSYCQDTTTFSFSIPGQWKNEHTGFIISSVSITKLYKVDNGWNRSTFNSDQFYFIDSTIIFNNNEFTIWGASPYTSKRLYLTNGSEESVETMEYKIFKFELVDKDLLKVTVSNSWYIHQPNVIPHIFGRYEIKKKFSTTPEFGAGVIFKKCIE